MQKASKKYPLFVNDFFMKRLQYFMGTVVKDSFDIEHYWGRVEFIPRRGQIHVHMLGIAKDMAYLKDFYMVQTMEDKGVVINKYARETLDLYADVDIKDDDRNYFPVHPETPLSKKFYEVTDEAEDVRLLC